jgi:hypothetical protein
MMKPDTTKVTIPSVRYGQLLMSFLHSAPSACQLVERNGTSPMTVRKDVSEAGWSYGM